MPFKKAGFKILAVLAGVILTLFIVEAALPFFYPSDSYYYANQPGLRYAFTPAPGILPGIHGTSRFYTNSEGIRGEEFSQGHAYRILAVGGSTTECLYLDEGEAWPALLQNCLEKHYSKDIWVGNIGRSGYSVDQNTVQLQYLLPQYPDIDLLILLAGGNDFLKFMAGIDKDRDPDPNIVLNAKLPVEQDAWYKRSFTYFALKKTFKTIQGWMRVELRQDKLAENYVHWRHYRQKAPTLVDSLPEMKEALDRYKQDLNAIIAIAGRHNIKLLMLTQPAMWKDTLTDYQRSLLWMGGIGKYQLGKSNGYYTPRALAQGVKAYNNTMLLVADSNHIPVLDLATHLPKDTTVFYDDMHFNENGAGLIAADICFFMKQNEDKTGISR